MRDRTVEALCEHFARDDLAMEELERRLDRVHRARSVQELRGLLADLPGGGDSLQRVPDRGAPPAVQGAPGIPARNVPGRRTVVALFGGNSRRGRWIPGRRTLSVAVFGGVELDFREASLGPGVTEVTAFAVMGGVEVIVPPGTWVESDGVAIMGGFANVDEHPVDPGPDDTVLRVRGLAVMGNVEVTVRLPGESRHEARRRRREEQRRRRIGDG